MTTQDEALKLDLTRRQVRNRAWDLALKHKLGELYAMVQTQEELRMGYIEEYQVPERKVEHFETFKADLSKLYQRYLAECFGIIEDVNPGIAAQVDDRLEEELPDL